MIKINLLPFRLARKKENIRRQVSIFFLLIVFTLVLLAWYTMGIDQKIARKKVEIIQVKAQIALYREKANRVTEIKKKLKLLEDKLKIVGSLKEKRKEQLALLEEMSDKIIPERMWIESLKADSSHVAIKGVAFDNPTIADFMRNLEDSAIFSGVDLKRSKIQKFQDNIMLKSFELLCRKKIADPENRGKDKKGK